MIKKKIDQITEVRKIEGKWNLDSICQFHLISTSTINIEVAAIEVLERREVV